MALMRRRHGSCWRRYTDIYFFTRAAECVHTNDRHQCPPPEILAQIHANIARHFRQPSTVTTQPFHSLSSLSRRLMAGFLPLASGRRLFAFRRHSSSSPVPSFFSRHRFFTQLFMPPRRFVTAVCMLPGRSAASFRSRLHDISQPVILSTNEFLFLREQRGERQPRLFSPGVFVFAKRHHSRTYYATAFITPSRRREQIEHQPEQLSRDEHRSYA